MAKRRKKSRSRSKKQDINKYAPLALILILALLAWFLLMPEDVDTPGDNDTTVACAQDTKTCPDGTVLSRSPSKNCAFPSCPAINDNNSQVNFSFEIDITQV